MPNLFLWLEEIGIANLVLNALTTAAIGYLLRRLVRFARESAAQNKAIRAAALAGLKHDIVDGHGRAASRGRIEKYALKAAEEQYEAYKMLGGNGFVDDLMRETRKLPIE